MREALANFRATGAGLRWPYYLALLAELYERAGQADEGLTVVDEALAAAAAHGERWCEAEIHRLRGELLLRQGGEAGAEAAFGRALDVARAQQAKSLELRSATSLARLWLRQGRRDDARAALEPVYAWFTEGFDTPDLVEARQVLNVITPP